jgi:hypothetical protein
MKIKGFTTEKMKRMACFAAHHKEGCNASTVLLSPEDNDSEEGSESVLKQRLFYR